MEINKEHPYDKAPQRRYDGLDEWKEEDDQDRNVKGRFDAGAGRDNKTVVNRRHWSDEDFDMEEEDDRDKRRKGKLPGRTVASGQPHRKAAKKVRKSTAKKSVGKTSATKSAGKKRTSAKKNVAKKAVARKTAARKKSTGIKAKRTGESNRSATSMPGTKTRQLTTRDGKRKRSR